MAYRVVVTGSAGMLGGNLVRRLVLAGHEVIGVDLRRRPTRTRDGATGSATYGTSR